MPAGLQLVLMAQSGSRWHDTNSGVQGSSHGWHFSSQLFLFAFTAYFSIIRSLFRVEHMTFRFGTIGLRMGLSMFGLETMLTCGTPSFPKSC